MIQWMEPGTTRAGAGGFHWPSEEDAQRADLEANLRLTPAERLAELVAMNRFHDGLQSRTLGRALRKAILEVERETARRRLDGHEA